MEKKIIAIFMFLSALLGFGASEVVDEKIHIPLLETSAAEHPQKCPAAIILAYTDSGKYFCECVGAECPCVSTEEILSELG